MRGKGTEKGEKKNLSISKLIEQVSDTELTQFGRHFSKASRQLRSSSKSSEDAGKKKKDQN